MTNTNSIDLIDKSVTMQSFNTQLQVLQDKFLDSNIVYHNGHQFTVSEKLISICKNYLDEKRVENVTVLDDYRLPVTVTDLQKFYDDIWNTYQVNLNAYHSEYNRLVEERGNI